jgi:hypothetical protein
MSRGGFALRPITTGKKLPPRETVLIVTEGRKTERKYFEAIRKEYHLPRETIRIEHGEHTDPGGIVDDVIRIFNEDPFYDWVFCVFDKDGHLGYQQAKDRIRSLKLRKREGGLSRVSAITSVPCFEFWLLLHFTYTTRSFSGAGSRSSSPCEEVERELRSFWPDYAKGTDSSWERTMDFLDKAKRNAEAANRAASSAGTDNPTTLVFMAVDRIRAVGESQGCSNWKP